MCVPVPPSVGTKKAATQGTTPSATLPAPAPAPSNAQSGTGYTGPMGLVSMVRQPDGSMRAYDSVNGFDTSGREWGGQPGWFGGDPSGSVNPASRDPNSQPFHPAPASAAPPPAPSAGEYTPPPPSTTKPYAVNPAANPGTNTFTKPNVDGGYGFKSLPSTGAPGAVSTPDPTTIQQQPYSSSPTGGLPTTVTTPTAGGPTSYAVDNSYSPGASQSQVGQTPADRVSQVIARRFRPRDWSY